MKILFSEHESFYRNLGLIDHNDLIFTFDGMRYYNDVDVVSKFDLFVCAFYTLPHNVILTLRFKKLNKKTVLCADGIFEFSNSFINPMVVKYGVKQFHPILQDYFICVGKEEAGYFNNEVNVYNFMPKRIIENVNIIQKSKYPKILITTANSAYFNDDEYASLLKLILGVCQVLRTEEIDFSLRIFDRKLLKDIYAHLGSNIYNDIEMGFEDTLKNYSSVLTTPSSIAVSAMYHQRSVSLMIYRDFPLLLKTGWLTPSSDVFKANLSGFIHLDSDRMNIQNQFLKSYLTENKLTDLLLQISKISESSENKHSFYVNESLLNMLNSKFNINLEWAARRVYLKFRKMRFFQMLREIIK